MTLWERFVSFASRPRFVIGASVFRVIAGAAILLQYLATYKQRLFIFGPNGIYPLDATSNRGGFSVYTLSPSPAFFEVVYHVSIVVAALWFLGWKTRWLTPVLYVLWTSLHRRLPLFGDGGDNMMTIVFVYACFADLNAYFAIETREPPRPGLQSDLRRDLSAMFHNGAILAFALQIALVYGVAGLTKVQGETWRNGTAIYYAMSGTYRLPGVSEAICRHDWVVNLLSYSAVAFQVSFPWFIFLNRYTRILAVAAGMCFHLGIGIVLGLVTFATLMMAVDLALVSDEEYRAAYSVLLRITTGIEGHLRRRWPRAKVHDALE